jgi:hypothetical protein
VGHAKSVAAGAMAKVMNTGFNVRKDYSLCNGFMNTGFNVRIIHCVMGSSTPALM